MTNEYECDEICKEIEYYNSLPYIFEDFIDLELREGDMELVCTDKQPAQTNKRWVPGYVFDICVTGEKVGIINLRIGYTEGLYYGGQIGYRVDEAHRGKNYAARACRLIAHLARAHGMTKLLIANDRENTASIRVCEKLGARLVRAVALPEWHDLYQRGGRFSNVYEWVL